MKIQNISRLTPVAIGIALSIGILNNIDINTTKYKNINDTFTNDTKGEEKSSNNKEALILVNKDNPLESNYEPLDLKKPNIPFVTDSVEEEQKMREVASNAIEELFNVAKSEDIKFLATSAYRSYNTQHDVYTRRVQTKGKVEADKYVAQPGKSEHQTGLSIDVTNTRRKFTKNSKEARWIVNNAYRFGFILRYPEGKEGITGISFEPWHVRYVGKEVARNIFEEGITLEEYIKNK